MNDYAKLPADFCANPDEAYTLPASYYTSAAVYAAEKENIFAKSWICVGHRSEVAENNAYITREVIGESIIVVRGRDGVLRAFYNVCPHRGHQLLSGEGKAKNVITCPYHAWTFKLDGELAHARNCDNVANFDKENSSLVQLKVEEYAGFIFINMNPDAEPVESQLPGLQERMRQARPYADKIRNITAHLSEANPEYKSPYMRTGGTTKAVGLIVVTTDKGLCGGLNTNMLRALTARMKDAQAAGQSVQTVAIGNKGFGFLNRIGANVVSHVVQLGDAPQLDKLIGPVKVMLDAFVEGKLDAVYLCYTQFINTMKQEPRIEALLPLGADRLAQSAEEKKAYGWDYIYEPDAATVINELLTRYIEALVYQAVAENMASEQSARMVAMKAATDNAGNLIAELKLVYNKTRQAAITKELSEIVGGAAAV